MFESSLKRLYIVNSLLIAAIFFSSLLVIRNIISISFTTKALKTTTIEDKTKMTAMTKLKDLAAYAPILEQNPFGSPMKLTPLSKTESSSPLTNIILMGTVVGPKNFSYAVFEDKSDAASGKQEVFRCGERVYNYGTLTNVKRDSVELTNGTNTFEIKIMELQIKEIQEKNTESNQTLSPRRISERHYILDQRRVQQALDKPEQILTHARLLPNIQDGKQEGFRVSEVKHGGLYDSLGLRNGDILLRVNNLEISNPEAAMQAFSALGGMNSVNLDIIRDGSKMTLSYEIR